jgi:hypothetical protein
VFCVGGINLFVPNCTTISQESAAEEDVERSLYELCASNLNVALEWTREIRIAILDTVKVD